MAEETLTGADVSAWAVVTLAGGTELAGRVSREDLFGEPYGRVDVPLGGDVTPVLFPASAIRMIVPTTEEDARGVAEELAAAEVGSWAARRRRGVDPGPAFDRQEAVGAYGFDGLGEIDDAG